MARGRSVTKYERLYLGGYDMSAYIMDTGEKGVDYEANAGTSFCLADLVTGAICGRPAVMLGPLNGVFDNTATSGLHVIANAAQGSRVNVMYSRGVLAVPTIGDDAFCVPATMGQYHATQVDNTSAVNLTFSGLDASAGLNYDEFFGALLHAMGAETGANSANTNADAGAASTAGGWLMYQVTSITGTGTVTISIDDSANGTTWAALSGATTGTIATASAPTSGFIQLATNATVRRYLRWQVAFGGSATACTFALAFMRGR